MLLQYLCSLPSKELRIHLNNELPRHPGKQPVGFTNEAFWMKERTGGTQSWLARETHQVYPHLCVLFPPASRLSVHGVRQQTPGPEAFGASMCPVAAAGTQASLSVPVPRASAVPL